MAPGDDGRLTEADIDLIALRIRTGQVTMREARREVEKRIFGPNVVMFPKIRTEVHEGEPPPVAA